MYVFNVTFISGKTFFLDFSCVKGTEIILLFSYFAFVISVNLICKLVTARKNHRDTEGDIKLTSGL